MPKVEKLFKFLGSLMLPASTERLQYTSSTASLSMSKSERGAPGSTAICPRHLTATYPLVQSRPMSRLEKERMQT